jgi:PhzF family phenazine biosynthesis protein
MQAVAREMALPETAFIVPPSVPTAHVRIRWFTPQEEVPLCGHATVASFHALAEAGMLGMSEPGGYSFNVETRSGVLPITVEKAPSAIEVFFGLPVPEFTRAGQFKLDVVRLLSTTYEEIESRLPIVAAGNLYVPVRRLHTVFALKPNMFALSQFLSNRNLGGLCVFTTETVERTSAVHSRFFAPNLGINEDPVTGSANGPLGVYLYERGLIEANGGRLSIIGEQGDVIGRRGRVTIRLTTEGAHVLAVQIGGRAVTVFDGMLRIG